MPSTLSPGRTDIAEHLPGDDGLVAVEAAFRAPVAGQALPPAILGVPATNGAFHVKAVGLVVSGLMTRHHVHTELLDVVPGLGPGRTSDEEEITLFDSTGTALQDVAAAVAVYEKTVRLGRGEAIDLGH